MHLLQTEVGKVVRVIRFQGGVGVEQKLRQLGLLPGNSLRLVRKAPLGGPVLVEVDGRTIAIGRGVAAKIIVEEDQSK
jgi:ferrous iron transport protein A